MQKAKNYKIMVIYKKTEEWYIEWHRMTTSDNECHRVVQQMTTSDITSDNEWQRVVQQVTTNDNKWQWVTKNDNSEWQRVIKWINTNESK